MEKKKRPEMSALIPQEIIENRIFYLRDKRVMLDRDLAGLYGVETRVITQAVKRNIERFPDDFMFQLTWEEVDNLKSQSEILDAGTSRSQSVILKRGKNIKYLPYAFTEQGVAMLSSVLQSKQAIQVNIQIMRAFVKIKEMVLTHADLKKKINAFEKKFQDHDEQFKLVFEAITQLLEPPKKPKKRIGF